MSRRISTKAAESGQTTGGARRRRDRAPGFFRNGG